MSKPRKKERTPTTLRKSDSASLRLVASGSESTTEGKSDSFLGKTIGSSFRVEKLLGMGGMGAVYLARDEALNRDVAVKILRRDLVESAAGILRFQREGEALARLDHEHIVKVYEFGLHDKTDPYIVMEYVPGRSLSHILKSSESLSIPRAIEIAMQLCSALDAAHTRRIVHRDLSPANVMVVEHTFGKETVKIVDFGIARIASDSQIKLTNADEIVGSPMYMSPEQCAGSNVNHRSDLYSLGCILFECLTAVPPFTAESSLAIMMKQQQDTPMTLAQAAINRDFPVELEKIVAKLLEKAPENRYQYADEVRHQLEAFCNTEVFEAVCKGWARDLWPKESMPLFKPKVAPPAPAKKESNKELRIERQKLRSEVDKLVGKRSALWWSAVFSLAGFVLFTCCVIIVCSIVQCLRQAQDLNSALHAANRAIRHNSNPYFSGPSTISPPGLSGPYVGNTKENIVQEAKIEATNPTEFFKSHIEITKDLMTFFHSPLRSVSVRYCWVMNDTLISHLQNIPTLRSLDLTRTATDNEDMKAVNRNLHTLALNCTLVSDKGIEQLERLKNLRHLELRKLALSGKSLQVLSKLKLDYLDITDCRGPTDSQISDFERSHPNCVVKTKPIEHEND